MKSKSGKGAMAKLQSSKKPAPSKGAYGRDGGKAPRQISDKVQKLGKGGGKDRGEAC